MRKLITIIATLCLGGFILSACSSSGSWEPSNISSQENVNKSVACDQVKSASDALNKADADKDSAVLKTLGVKDDESNFQQIQGFLKTRQEACSKGDSGPSSSAQTPISASAADCPNGYPLQFDPNHGDNVNSEGTENNQKVKDTAKRDPKALAIYASNSLKKDKIDANNWRELATPNLKCLSDKGVQVYMKLEGALDAEGTQVDENATAPSNWYNTGMDTDGPVVNPTPGISGDLRAIKYTFADGSVMYVMKRCGNVPQPSMPNWKVKPIGGTTTSPPPTGNGCVGGSCTPVTTPPTSTPPNCPPGQEGTRPGICKEGNGAPTGVAPQQQPIRLPASPEMAQPTRPAGTAPTYTAPVTTVAPVPQNQGGPTPNPGPRNTPTPEAGAPAPSAPETECFGC